MAGEDAEGAGAETPASTDGAMEPPEAPDTADEGTELPEGTEVDVDESTALAEGLVLGTHRPVFTAVAEVGIATDVGAACATAARRTRSRERMVC